MNREMSSSFVSVCSQDRFSTAAIFTGIAGIDMVLWLYILQEGGWVKEKGGGGLKSCTVLAIPVKTAPSASIEYKHEYFKLT